MQEVQGQEQAMQQQQMGLEQAKIATGDPMNDPSKTPQLAEALSGQQGGLNEAQPPA